MPGSSSRLDRRERGPGELALSRFLPYRLSIVAAAVSEGLARHYAARFGIGIPEWRVLATIAEFDSVTAGGIGAHARMGKVKVSRAARALREAGLIDRGPNKDDRREAFLTLTVRGRAVYGEVAPLALAYEADLLDPLSATERAMLERIIDKLLDRASLMEARAATVGPGQGTQPEA